MSILRDTTKYKLRADFGMDPDVLEKYDEPHRYYHNWDHIEHLLTRAEDLVHASDVLFLSILFHDIIYDPRSDYNESNSAVLFSNHYRKSPRYDKEVERKVRLAIEETKDHKGTFTESKILCNLDMEILDSSLAELLEYEEKIFKEYQFHDFEAYRKGRCEFLRKYSSIPGSNLRILADIVESRKLNVGIYAGSFNPFHVGHMNIVRKAEKIFDKIIVARGVNPTKGAPEDDLHSVLPFHQVEKFGGLLTDFVKELPKNTNYTLIRGLRNGADLQFEMNQYRFLQDLDPEIKVVQILCDREYEHVSSSAVRQLKEFKADGPYLVKK